MEKEKITDALRGISYPGFSRDIVSFGIVSKASVCEQKAVIELELSTQDSKIVEELKKSIEKKLLLLPEISDVEINVVTTQKQNNGDQAAVSSPNLDGVKAIIAIASGKGGVGKSTVAVNLACALAKTENSSGEKLKIGLMDCDVYGPSIPQLLGCWQRPEIIGDNRIAPVENYGIKMISMGLLVDEDSPVVWRGPMIMKTIQQFASNVDWGELDFLLIDLPPGTGDAQLSIAQVLTLDGAVIVTTPQRTAFDVAKRGARMFEKLNIPYLGVVENMSYAVEASTNAKTYPFGKGGGKVISESLQTELLSEIPLDTEIREGGDHGIPVVIGAPDANSSEEFNSLARKLSKKFSF